MSEKPSFMAGMGMGTEFPDTGGSQDDDQVRRFWMPRGGEKKIVFLTNADDAPAIYEHQVKLGNGRGAFQNWFTCLESLGKGCPLCKWSDENDEFRRSMVLFLTVIDVAGYTSKTTGKVYTDLKRLYAAKKGTAESLNRKVTKLIERDKPLRGAMFEVFRKNDDKSPGAGSDFDYVEHVDLDGFEDATEYDYAEILKPDPDKVAKCIKQLQAERGAMETPPPNEDDIPF